jgi:hypothetical protein
MMMLMAKLRSAINPHALHRYVLDSTFWRRPFSRGKKQKSVSSSGKVVRKVRFVFTSKGRCKRSTESQGAHK